MSHWLCSLVDNIARLNINWIWNHDRMEENCRNHRWKNREIQNELFPGCIFSAHYCWNDMTCLRIWPPRIYHARNVIECCWNYGWGTWLEKWYWSSYDSSYSACMGTYNACNNIVSWKSIYSPTIYFCNIRNLAEKVIFFILRQGLPPIHSRHSLHGYSHHPSLLDLL